MWNFLSQLLVIMLCLWPSLSFSKEMDTPCPPETTCSPSKHCHWFNEFKALGPGTVEYRERLPKVRQAVCNQEEAKICCPRRTHCPAGQHCVNSNNCSSHQKNVIELRGLRGTEEYKQKREQIRANTTICSKPGETKKVCCSQPTLLDPDDDDIPCSCGCRPELTFSLFITGGKSSTPGSWPWVAVLKYRDQTPAQRSTIFCGGSLITRSHVLTAAHCLSSPDLGPVDRVVLGENDIRTDYDCREVTDQVCEDFCPCRKYRDGTRQGGKRCWEENQCADKAQVVPVLRATKHPGFRKKGNVPFNDIAVLTLDRSITLSNWIIPICLRTSGDLPPGSPVILTGWGNTQPYSFSSTPASAVILQSLEKRVVDTANCSKDWLDLGLQENQMCATSGMAGQAGCQGDSGGPLVRVKSETRQDLWELVGITSAGPNKCGSRTPAIYTKINQDMISWIRGVVGEQLPRNSE